MSTRGAIGIRYREVDKVGYNHFDSYPTGLGDDLLHYLKGKTVDELKNLYDRMENDDKSDIWQGNGFNEKFEEYNSFLHDSLFCEFAYIVNLDKEVLEFYIGFNKNPQADGRYASFYSEPDSVYCGVKLVKEIPLSELFAGEWKADEEKDFVKCQMN